MCMVKYIKRQKFAQTFSVVNSAFIDINEIDFELRKDAHLQKKLLVRLL